MTIKYFIGTIELDRGGGFCVQHFLFSCYKTRPSKRVWEITKDWYPNVSHIDEKRRKVFFNNWKYTATPSIWLEISREVYEQTKFIIQEVK